MGKATFASGSVGVFDLVRVRYVNARVRERTERTGDQVMAVWDPSTSANG